MNRCPFCPDTRSHRHSVVIENDSVIVDGHVRPRAAQSAGDKSEPRERTPASGNPSPSIPASSGTPEARVCETWCGIRTRQYVRADCNWWLETDDGERKMFCTVDCRWAGRPLNPPGTQPTKRGVR